MLLGGKTVTTAENRQRRAGRALPLGATAHDLSDAQEVDDSGSFQGRTSVAHRPR
jgi:hypothetical protein